ncbi:MAG: magnesium chelatase domain-containing protein [Tepidisphaeraceae bacterium]
MLCSVLSKIHSYVLVGIDAILCDVEVNVEESGMRSTTMVGLPQTAVKESVERVFQAIANCSYPLKPRKVVINLAPADVKKEGPSLDLPIAIGLLRASKFITTDTHKKYLLAGELALDGRIRKIKGALSLALLAKSKEMAGVIVPQENAREAAVVDGIDVIAVSTLPQAVSFLNGQLDLEPYQLDGEPYALSQLEQELDFSDVRGQEAVKRAITIACAVRTTLQ